MIDELRLQIEFIKGLDVQGKWTAFGDYFPIVEQSSSYGTAQQQSSFLLNFSTLRTI